MQVLNITQHFISLLFYIIVYEVVLQACHTLFCHYCVCGINVVYSLHRRSYAVSQKYCVLTPNTILILLVEKELLLTRSEMTMMSAYNCLTKEAQTSRKSLSSATSIRFKLPLRKS